MFIEVDYEGYEKGVTIKDVFKELLVKPGTAELKELSIGSWGEPYEQSSAIVVEELIAAKDQLPRLKSLFIGEMESEDCEISWIVQSDLSPLLKAFPQLEELKIRGSVGLRLSELKHANLRKLVIECGGLGQAVISDIVNGDLPELRHLELYLGEDNYGFNGNLEDIKPLMEIGRFPRLEYLGLRDSEIADEIAEAIAEASVLDQIHTLDLSLGTLSDEGAESLLKSSKVKKLKKLDLHYHFMTDGMVNKLKRLGIDVDVSDQNEGEEYDGETWRYISVSE